MTPDEVFERLLALEAEAVGSLDEVTRVAVDLVKKEAHAENAISVLSTAFAGDVVQLRREVRVEAAESVGASLGMSVDVSETDDTERGEKAAAYYAKAWSEGLGEGDWAEAVERALEAAKSALEDVACYEVFDAWNDEVARAIGTLNEAADKARGRWNTKHDSVVCPECAKLDRKTSGRDGLFDLPKGKRGRPPLHPNCRCYVVPIEPGKADEATEGSERMQPELVTRDGALVFKAIRAEDRTVDFVASTNAVDSHGEVVEQDWRLEDYLANPVVLYAHNNRELPIGRATNVGVRNGRLEATIKLASAEANPRAEEVWKLIQEGVLRAVSVGFMPTDGRYETRDGNEIFVWKSPILKEISVVPVPANQQALARMKSAFAEKNSDRIYEGKPMGRIDATTLLTLDIKTTEPAASPETTTTGGDAEQEQVMSKDLQDKIEAQAKDIGTLTVERDSAVQTAAKLEDSLRTIEAKVKTLETEKSALEAQNKSLVLDRDEALAHLAKAQEAAIELEVEALVGDKITPAEKEVFLDLRKANPDLFAKMIAQRAPLNLTKPITEKGAVNGASVGGDTTGLLAKVKKSAGL